MKLLVILFLLTNSLKFFRNRETYVEISRITGHKDNQYKTLLPNTGNTGNTGRMGGLPVHNIKRKTNSFTIL